MGDKTIGQIAWEAGAKLKLDSHDWESVPRLHASYEAAASAVWDQAVEACSQICFYMAAESTCANAPEMNATDAFDYAGETLRSLKRSDKTESDNAK